MKNNGRLLILVMLGVLIKSFVVAKKYNITVGYLPCIKGEVRDRQGISISGALSMALEEINNNTALLPDVNLVLQWNDTKCDTEVATKIITQMSNSGVLAFFGAERQCQTEAVIAHSRNLPMISYKCMDYQNSTLPNFARLNPPETQAMKAVISLLRYYRWKKFSILHEKPWMAVASMLQNYAENNNMTVNQNQLVVDSFTCCEENMACCDGRFLRQLVQETKKRTRIYVFLGTTSGLIDFMTTMESLQLFENGEFMVIFVDMMSYSSEDTMKYLISIEDRGLRCPNTSVFRKRAQSLLVVVSSVLESSYSDFLSDVRQYNSREPFKFPKPLLVDKKFLQYVSIYAAYLYDSVKLYATALHSLIEEDTTHKNETLTYERLMSVATNGSRIVSKMVSITPFKSVTGTDIRLDNRAESEGNFSLLAFKPIVTASCPYSMVPVGYFQRSTKEFPVYKMNPRLPIDWPDNVKPEDEPSCGFLKEKCPKDESQITLTATVTIAVVVLCVCCVFFTLLIVKKLKTRTLHNLRAEHLLVVDK